MDGWLGKTIVFTLFFGPICLSFVYGGNLDIAHNSTSYRKNQHEKIQNILFNLEKDAFQLDFRSLTEYGLKRAPVSSVGEPWPQPQIMTKIDDVLYRFDTSAFDIVTLNVTCDIIKKAIQRYKDMLFQFETEDTFENLYNIKNAGLRDTLEKIPLQSYENAKTINSLSVLIRTSCSEYPSLSSDESYTILVKPVGIFIVANEVWGALRGLETFSQLIFKYKEKYFMKDVSIRDFPRFPHRGVLIDTARHFMRIDVIHDVIDGMVMNKMNVLHWHIVDDQSFPYQSKVFPDLSAKGAYHQTLVYTQNDIKEILEYARIRGVRVIPEFDVPAHTFSWGFGHPDLLTQCYDSGYPVPALLGPMNPVRNYTYEFLAKFFNETFSIFKDKYFHLGGDEVPLDCWISNPEVVNFKKQLLENTSLKSFHRHGSMWRMVDYFTQRLVKNLTAMAEQRNKEIGYIFWEEAFKKNIQIPEDSIIQIWMGNTDSILNAISKGYRVLFSSCWYLDYLSYGVDWHKYYNCKPFNYDFGPKEKQIMGGEVCMWSEFINNENLINRLWPRGSAAAERLWSNKKVMDIHSAGRRLQEHTCRMLRRGLNVGNANGPDYCLRPKHRKTSTVFLKDTEYSFVSFSNSLSIKSYRKEYVVIGFIFPLIGILITLFLFIPKIRRKRVLNFRWIT